MLSLKQMQDTGISGYFSNKELDKQIQAKLLEQQQALAATTAEPAKKAMTLNEILSKGGQYTYRFEGKKYKLSVLTPKDINVLDNIDNFNEEGLDYKRPAVYKFHLTTALGNRLYVQAKTHSIAQSIVDTIFGKGYYRISSS